MSKGLTEVIELPSQGWFYPEGHPLASGKLDVYLMTAKHEDILSSRNLLQKGVVLDKLMEALIATPGVSYNDMLVGDKDALLVASRILGYGAEYPVKITCTKCGTTNDVTIDLGQLQPKDLTFDKDTKGTNRFQFTLPMSKKVLTFKFLTHKDEKEIDAEITGLKKVNPNFEGSVTTRLKKIIIAVDGEENPEKVRKFVESEFLARDNRAFRDHLKKVNPGVDMTFDFVCPTCGETTKEDVPITVNFFWPDA